ncbi:uncharacterized protein LOC121381916 [Gigantopelta aegis]|uniref:uncharacterized protein LOC121381916 n=1 Tax=Gigantopelta aegis TaxID=1735272 RepID=UPI001B8896D6|nr:uncharacterized protein LOC121381916 [Gigantopelta aegis]
MDKAARAVRRSSVKLLSLGGCHGDLNVLISEVKDMRNTAKAFLNAQNAASQDFLKWASNEENRAIQDVANQLAELNLAWSEIQREFIEHIKEHKRMFEMVLEGEKHVFQAKNNFVSCEQREYKIRKEIKKAFKKASSAELQILENRLLQAERAKDLAQIEVGDRHQENEAVKLIRIKDGLLKMSESYIDYAKKCSVIFEAQRDIALQLPDVHDQDLHDIKYTGSGTTKFVVQEAKEKVRQYRRKSDNLHQSPHQSTFEPPPPYSPGEYITSDTSLYSSPSFTSNSEVSPRRPPNSLSSQGRQNTLDDDAVWDSDYEEDLTGAMGGAKI